MRPSTAEQEAPTFARFLAGAAHALARGAAAYAWIFLMGVLGTGICLLLTQILPSFLWSVGPVEFVGLWWRAAINVSVCLVTFRLLAGNPLPLTLEALIYGLGRPQVFLWQAAFAAGALLGGYFLFLPLLLTVLGLSLAICVATFEDATDFVGVMKSVELTGGFRFQLTALVTLFGVLPSLGLSLLQGILDSRLFFVAGVFEDFFLCLVLTVAYFEIRKARRDLDEEEDFYQEYFPGERDPEAGEVILDSDWDALYKPGTYMDVGIDSGD